MKLQRKMFLLFSCMFGISTIIIIFLCYNFSNQIIIRNFKQQSEENQEYIAITFDSEFEQLKSIVNTIIYNPSIHERISKGYMNKSDINKIEINMNVDNTLLSLQTFPIFEGVEALYIFGDSGSEYWYGNTNYIEYRNALRQTLMDVKVETNTLEYLGMKSNTISSDFSLCFINNIHNTYGEPIGKVYIELKGSHFNKLSPENALYNDSELYLLDEMGDCIYSNIDNVAGKTVDLESLSGIITQSTLNQHNFLLVSSTPQQMIIEDSVRILEFATIIMLISLFLGAIVLYLAVRKLLFPLNKLSKAIEKVQAGNYDIQINNNTNDELGDLANTFNKMVVQIKNSREQELEFLHYTNELEYQALQAQINPHFICNTLNSLRWMAEIRKANNIVALVDLLWELMRKTASVKGQLVTLKEELEIVDAFIGIQQIRYNGKFIVEYDIKQEHKNIMIPKFILQPIIENSIFHGIEPKKGMGKIIVCTKTQSNCLYMMVSDDGIGMTEEQQENLLLPLRIKEQGLNGIGVGNVNERMINLYGKEYALKVSSKIGQGTALTFTIPLNKNNT